MYTKIYLYIYNASLLVKYIIYTKYIYMLYICMYIYIYIYIYTYELWNDLSSFE